MSRKTFFKYTNNIEFLKDNLSFIYIQWIICFEVKKNYKDVFNNGTGKVLINSIQRSFFTNLAILSDPEVDGLGHKNISIKGVQNLDKNFDSLIYKIKQIRNKILAHNDLEWSLNLDKYPIKIEPDEVELLLNHLIDIVEKHSNQKFPKDKVKLDTITEFKSLFGLN